MPSSFVPYRLLPSLPFFDAAAYRGRRRVLVDAGANGFYASPKYLLDACVPAIFERTIRPTALLSLRPCAAA